MRLKAQCTVSWIESRIIANGHRGGRRSYKTKARQDKGRERFIPQTEMPCALLQERACDRKKYNRTDRWKIKTFRLPSDEGAGHNRQGGRHLPEKEKKKVQNRECPKLENREVSETKCGENFSMMPGERGHTGKKHPRERGGEPLEGTCCVIRSGNKVTFSTERWMRLNTTGADRRRAISKEGGMRKLLRIAVASALRGRRRNKKR